MRLERKNRPAEEGLVGLLQHPKFVIRKRERNVKVSIRRVLSGVTQETYGSADNEKHEGHRRRVRKLHSEKADEKHPGGSGPARGGWECG